MSKVTELAKAEAEETEAAEAEETEPKPEPEPEPEPSEPPEPEAVGPTAEDLAKLERENERHGKRVQEIMGAAFKEFEQCRECGGLGYAPQSVPMQAHENYRECATCAGYGQVLTGSRNVNHLHATCPRCQGRGFLERIEPPPANPYAPQANGPQTVQYGAPSWMGDTNVTTGAFPPPPTPTP